MKRLINVPPRPTLILDRAHRQDAIADYLATKYDLKNIAHLLLRLNKRIEAHEGPLDTDTLDRWLVELAGQPQSTAPAPLSTDTPSLVYYMLFNGLVKIGTTTCLPARLSATPHDELLAIEDGGRDLEKQRHAQFAALHYHREWYRYEEPLVQHISQVAAKRAP